MLIIARKELVSWRLMSHAGWKFTVKDGARHVADIETNVLTIEGETYWVHGRGWLHETFILESPDGFVARAEKPSMMFRSFYVLYDERRYTLRARWPWMRTFDLLDNDRSIGSIARRHPFTEKAKADLPTDWPIGVRVFLIWLVLLLWEREDRHSG